MKRLLPNLLRLAVLIILITFLVQPGLYEPLLKPLVQANAPAIYNQGSLLSLTLSHLATVFTATLAATIVAVGLAILVTRPIGAEFLPLSRSLVNIGQTFPPVAVLALAVPAVGFGEKPTLIALFLYGLLPIFENAMTGLSTLPPAIVEAARGTGMTGWQRLAYFGVRRLDRFIKVESLYRYLRKFHSFGPQRYVALRPVEVVGAAVAMLLLEFSRPRKRRR